MHTLASLRQEPHLSVHSIRTWLDCPRKWRLKYIDRIKPAFRSVALALGTSLHHALGYALLEHAAGRKIVRRKTLAVLRQTLDRELTSEGPPVLLEDNETLPELHAQAAAMLLAGLDALVLPDRVIGVEVPFRLELADGRGGILPLPLIGSVDVVTEESGHVIYTELKSAKRRWSEDQVLFDMQLTAYGVALRSMGHSQPRGRLMVVTKAKTPAVQLEEPHRGTADERDLIATAASMLRGLKAGVDHPVRSWACKTCAFAGACQ